jgi:thiamine biosynthesis protein ThiI
LTISETTLVAYNEIALKSKPVRRMLESRLASQIEAILTRKGLEGVKVMRRFGRLYVEGATTQDSAAIAKVFGVASVMPSQRTFSDRESVLRLAVRVASERIGDGQSFAVRPKVVGKHEYSSQDLAVETGSAVNAALSGRGVYVNLSEPDVTLYIEVRDRDAFVYTEIIKGVGGLPYGSQGRLVALFSGGIDSPVAMWLMMKRGAETLPLFMDQRPHVGESYVDRSLLACKTISEFVPSTNFGLYSAPMGNIMGRILETSKPGLRCVLCKRSMYRIASAFAEEHGAKGIVTGESLGQVASQTLDNLFVLEEAVDFPVMRPTIGFDKLEIERKARAIGTYSVTAHTVEGCTVVPDRPTTRARIEEVHEAEKALGLIELCTNAVSRIEFIEIDP